MRALFFRSFLYLAFEINLWLGLHSLLFNWWCYFDLQADNSSHGSEPYLLCSYAFSGAWYNGNSRTYYGNGLSVCLS